MRRCRKEGDERIRNHEKCKKSQKSGNQKSRESLPDMILYLRSMRTTVHKHFVDTGIGQKLKCVFDERRVCQR